MDVKLAYGRTGLDVTLPDDANITVIENQFVPPLPDPAGALSYALQAPLESRPLRELVRADQTVAVVFRGRLFRKGWPKKPLIS